MFDEKTRLRRRGTFDEVPELYARARPEYPDPLIDDLVRLAGLAEGDRVVEIGCGPGKATRPLAERGLDVTAVELGSRLAALARRNLARYRNVRVVNADFESWATQQSGYAAVTAFSSFHWIAPERRYALCARLLREGGAICVVEVRHVLLDDADPFWQEVQADYLAVAPEEFRERPPRPEEVSDLTAEMEASGHFGHAVSSRHFWQAEYGADDYVAVIDTYSAMRTLDPERRRSLYDRIHRRIEARPGGSVTTTYLATLSVARRPP